MLIRLGEHYTKLATTESSQGPVGYQTLDSARSHLLAVLASLDHSEQWEALIQLVRSISKQEGYLELQGHWLDRKTVLETGLKAVRIAKDQENESIFLTDLGITERRLGRPDEAVRYALLAKQLSHDLGRLNDEAIDLVNLGMAYIDLHRIDEAIDCFEQALAISRLPTIKNYYLECSCLLDLGVAHASKGSLVNNFILPEVPNLREGVANVQSYLRWNPKENWRIAINYYRQARRIARKYGHLRIMQRIMGNILSSLGKAYQLQGNTESAIKVYIEALAVARQIGDRAGEALRLANLATAYANQGKTQDAITQLEQAISIFKEIHSPHLEEALQELAQLQAQSSTL